MKVRETCSLTFYNGVNNFYFLNKLINVFQTVNKKLLLEYLVDSRLWHRKLEKNSQKTNHNQGSGGPQYA